MAITSKSKRRDRKEQRLLESRRRQALSRMRVCPPVLVRCRLPSTRWQGVLAAIIRISLNYDKHVMAAVISLYEGSTQFRNWRFSPAQLSVLRTQLNHGATTVIKSNFETNQVYLVYGLLFGAHWVVVIARFIGWCPISHSR
jgi:hypothetical protein